MKISCSFCRADIGEKEPLDADSVTYGVCDACAGHFARQWDGLETGESREQVPL